MAPIQPAGSEGGSYSSFTARMPDALVSLKSKARNRADSVKSIDSCNLDNCNDDGEERAGFGQKTITWWGSFCLNLNNCMGPAMVLLPLVNQQAGWFTPTLALTIVYVLSSLAAAMLCDAMQRIPGNAGFGHRYEFATTVQHYYGRKAYVAFQIFYNISMQASNIAAMIISAQVIDQFFSKLGGHSFALDFEHMKFIKSTGVPTSPWCEKGYFVDNDCEVGHQLTWVISVGYLLAMGICIPFGYMNLVRKLALLCICVCSLTTATPITTCA